MKNTFSLLICLCTFIFVHPAYAAPFPSLTGSVTDTTGLLTGKKDIIDRAERFQQNTGITVYILFTHQENIIPANNSELQAVAHPITDMDHNSILLIVTTDSQQIYLLSSSALQPRLKASRALTIIVNHTSAYLQHGLWFQGINTALDVLQAALLQQPTPSLAWYASSENPHQDDFPGHPLGFLLWILVFMCCTWIFRYTTRLRYALKFAFAMACGNLCYQALCLYFGSGVHTLNRVAPLWATIIGVSTFLATLLWTRKRR